jgi:hypothetical protein
MLHDINAICFIQSFFVRSMYVFKAYAERKVGQAAEMKRFGAAYFASASRQDALPQIIVEALTSE